MNTSYDDLPPLTLRDIVAQSCLIHPLWTAAQHEEYLRWHAEVVELPADLTTVTRDLFDEATGRRVLCGRCHRRHNGVDAVRVCCAGQELWPCTWLVVRGRDEDGQEIISECGADSWLMAAERGYECAKGHSHVNAEARAREGWDYAADELEAEGLRRNGVDAVAMNGGSI
jgi:hypothetical protein